MPSPRAGNRRPPEAERVALWKVKSGFWHLDDIVSDVAEIIHDQGRRRITEKTAEKRARTLVTRLWNQQLRSQRAWPARTISDKLEQAFDSLRRNRKILARMNNSCCQTCGIAEISEDQDDDTRGYVFFHEQTTEDLVEHGGDIFLYHGSFTKSERKNLAVAKMIIGSLRKAGLSVQWSGNTKQAIHVKCTEWRRRLPDGEDEAEDDGDYMA